jgi:hypothetical protein
MRYQEVAERYVIDQKAGRYTFMDHPGVLDMFNVRFLIFEAEKGRITAQERPTALGNAWFVDTLRTVPTADEELAAIGAFDPRTTAIVNEAYAAPLKDLVIRPDSTDTIHITSYHPERLTYRSSCKNERLAVFSEVYYPPSKGWKTYIDGQPAADIVKVNYVLRGLRVPAGEHTVEMRFEPRSYHTGRLVGLSCSILMFAGLGFAIFMLVRKGGAPVVPIGDYEPTPAATVTVRREGGDDQKPQRRRS